MEAEDRALRLPGDLGREPGHADVHLLHELRHRLPDGTLVLGAVALEPRLGVVPRNPAEEVEGFSVEVAHDGKAPEARLRPLSARPRARRMLASSPTRDGMQRSTASAGRRTSV